ncbi:MAG: hypothetical protein PWP64_392 [Candidatus Cloacimonadota bacterium]|nr:hypothetical protein [Candidatus Cloacimonadota bacterium]
MLMEQIMFSNRPRQARAKSIMHKTLFFYLFIIAFWSMHAEVINIGSGNTINQGLPIEPLARFSYTQQLYYGTEIGFSGTITALGFPYQVQSNLFYNGNKHWRIYLGHIDQTAMQEWIPVSGLSLVYDGILAADYFDAGLPGSGWLNIPLQESFIYDGVSNLLIAVDENTDGMGSSSDDFFCTEMSTVRALNFQSMTENPDPANPPLTIYPKTALANLRLYFGGETPPEAPQNLYGYYADGAIQLYWEAPQTGEVQAYRINRDGAYYAESAELAYCDEAIMHGSVYSYNVQAIFGDAELSPISNTVQIEVPDEGVDIFLNEGFEGCLPFAQEIPRFINLDQDGSPTWSWDNVDFPLEGTAMGWLVFAPALTTPPLTEISAASGTQMLMSASAYTPPNNDWLIFPNLHPGDSGSLSFQARSFTSAYGLERLRVLLSTSDTAGESFTLLHAEPWLAIPATWTEYEFDLSQYAGQDLYLALNCVSLDAFALFIDEIKVSGIGGNLGLPDVPQVQLRAYPNPSKGDFCLKSEHFFDLTIYNIRGQKVSTAKAIKEFDASSLQLSSGIYLLKIEQDGKSYTQKQVILP